MTIPKAPASALHEILKWSANRPVWQRDALRRIIAQGAVNNADVKELDRICRAQHGADASKEPALVVVPLPPCQNRVRHLPL